MIASTIASSSSTRSSTSFCFIANVAAASTLHIDLYFLALFGVAKYPTAIYRGTLAGFANSAPTKVEGSLTLHGVTRPLELTIKSFKCVPHPLYKRELCGADAYATFKRDAFGITAGKDYGFNMDVVLRIQVEALIDDGSASKVALNQPTH